MFLGSDGADAGERYQRLVASPQNHLQDKGRGFVGWNKKAIEKGDYFYGFSHEPFHHLRLPPRTYTITCFRDPLDRLFSHYRMLRQYQKEGVNHPCMETEGEWLKTPGGFEEFLNRIPPEHMLRQLYMFSNKFDIPEALTNIKKINLILSTNTIKTGVDQINLTFGMQLKLLHLRSSSFHEVLPEKSKKKALELLKKEYEFLSEVDKFLLHL